MHIELAARNEELERMASDYNEKSRQLAEEEEHAELGWELARNYYDDLVEAVEAVRMLLAFARQVSAFLPPSECRLGKAASSLDAAFNALPAWMRREIE